MLTTIIDSTHSHTHFSILTLLLFLVSECYVYINTIENTFALSMLAWVNYIGTAELGHVFNKTIISLVSITSS